MASPLPGAPLADVFDTFNGLPTHALLVHFTVVIATASALGGLTFALIPPFRRWLTGPLAVAGLASVVLGLITPRTGERLLARTGSSPPIDAHTHLGHQMGTIMVVYGLVLILTMLVVRYRGGGPTPDASPTAGGNPSPSATAPTRLDRLGGVPGRTMTAFPGQRWLAALLTVLVLAGAVVSGIWIYRTGDAGAKAVWQGVTAQPAPGSNGGTP